MIKGHHSRTPRPHLQIDTKLAKIQRVSTGNLL